MSELRNVVDKYLKKKKSEVENEWNRHSEAAGDAVARIETEEKSKGYDLNVTGRLACFGMKMWTLEYGKGSLMDRDNPFLDEYTHSRYWNPARSYNLNTVRTRPLEKYYDLDGNEHWGSGIMGKGDGLNIETAWGGYKWSFGKKNQVPVWPASHIVKEAMTRDNIVTQDFKQELLQTFGSSVVLKRLPGKVVIK